MRIKKSGFSTLLKNRGQELLIDLVEGADMINHFFGILFLSDDLSKNKLHRRQVLCDELVIIVNQLLKLLAFIEPLQACSINGIR